MADVIELLNRDYPRVIGCGDTETGHSSLLPSCFCTPTTFPSLPFLPLSQLHQSRPVLNTASPNVRLFSYSFILVFSFSFYFHWRYQRRTNLFLFSDEPHLHRPQGVSRRNKGWRRSVRKKESRNLRLELEIELFICLSVTMSRLLGLICFTSSFYYCSYYLFRF